MIDIQKSFYLLLCFWISIVDVDANPNIPEHYQFSVLDVNNGLSHNQVKSFLKDSRGFLWIGTEAGLNRFDGYKLKLYKYNSKDTSSLVGNSINKLFEDPDGNLWIQTNYGLSIYNPVSDDFYTDPNPFLEKYKLPGNDISHIQKDKEGNFWFLIKGQGISRYNPATKTTKSLFHSISDNSTISTNDVAALGQNAFGDIWIIHTNGILEKLDGQSLKVVDEVSDIHEKYSQPTGYGLLVDSENDVWINFTIDAEGAFFYQHQTKEIFHFKKGSSENSLNNNFTRAGIVEHSKGEIWIGTDHGGINVIDKENLRVEYILNDEDDKKSLSNNSINTLYKDDQGIIWAGTVKSGVNYYHENIIRFSHISHKSSSEESLPYDDVNTFVEDSVGNVWIGTNGGGLLYLNRATGKYTRYQHNPKDPNTLSSDVIISLLLDRNHILWIGTYMTGLNKFDGKKFSQYQNNQDDPKSLADNSVWEIYEDFKGNLWLGTLKAGVELFDRRNETFRHYPEGNSNIPLHCNYITSIAEDKKGNIWIGGGFGIDVINMETGVNKYYAHQSGNPKSLASNHVMDILKDEDDNIWVGTYDGLSLFDEKTEEFYNYTMEEGLPSNSIISILEDDNNDIWLSTTNGLSNLVLNRRDLGANLIRSFRNYGDLDGLQGKVYNENAGLKLSDGALIFGGSNGFNIFYPDSLFSNQLEPDIVFVDFQLFNRSVSVGERIDGRVLLKKSLFTAPDLTLKHNENVFSFEFAALSFVNPGKNQYRYKLEGFDKDWLTVGDQTRRVTYTNLDPGNYEFKVMASNNDGVWNENGTSIKLAVLAPFWKTTEAYAVYILAAIAVLYFLRRFMINRERLQFQIEQERRDAWRMHELDLMKIKFFTNVSHEFRTPLSLILAPVEKLIKTSSDLDHQKQYQMIQRNGKRLLNLVNQLLDFRKLEVEGMKLQLSELNIINFIEEAVQSFSDLSENKNIELDFHSNVNILHASFDMDKLEKILFNLLSNAFKFTPENGKISVAVNAFDNDSSSEGLKLVEIKVKDTGIGIPKNKLNQVFERFFTSDIPESMVNQGSGIGLSITKEFVKIHGGSIQVESEIGVGSCFTVVIPVKEVLNTKSLEINERISLAYKKDNLTHHLSDNEKVVSHGSKDSVVLIIEDNDDFRFYLKDNLNAHFKIVEARNGTEGWQKALANMPDLIVSDLMMPEMDGLELCSKVKNDPRTSHIPLVLLTANAADEQKLKGLKIGIEDYITKPFNFEILLTRLKNLIEQRQSLQKVLEKKISVQTSAVDIVSMDDRLIQKAVKVVEENLSNPDFSVEDLSKEIGMSRVYLYKKLMALTGKSPVEFIRHIRLQRAAQFLEKSQLSVAEVAYKVGFNNRKYFTKYFKNEYQVLPSVYSASKQKNP